MTKYRISWEVVKQCLFVTRYLLEFFWHDKAVSDTAYSTWLVGYD
ncbi:MAG: hypothetical protein QX196_06735 [Methylococcaceae bacterium]